MSDLGLAHFFQAYLHQDWPLEYVSVWAAVDDYFASEGEEAVASLIQDIETLQQTNPSEGELRRVVLDDLGCGFYPPGDGLTFHGFVAQLLARALQAQGAVRELSAVAVRIRLVTDAVAGLRAADITNVHELIGVGELLVAFETLCTQIFEWEISLAADQVRELEGIGALLGADKTLANDLWKDVVNKPS